MKNAKYSNLTLAILLLSPVAGFGQKYLEPLVRSVPRAVEGAAAKNLTQNAAADAARTYLLFSLKQPELADRYLKLFCAKSNTAKQYVQQWLPIVAASQLVKGRDGEKHSAAHT